MVPTGAPSLPRVPAVSSHVMIGGFFGLPRNVMNGFVLGINTFSLHSVSIICSLINYSSHN